MPAVISSVAVAIFWQPITISSISGTGIGGWSLASVSSDISGVVVLLAIFGLALVAAAGPFVHLVFSVELRKCYFLAFIVGDLLATVLPDVLFVSQVPDYFILHQYPFNYLCLFL